jgi:transposase
MRTLEEKQRILAAAAQPGASVALVARQHDLNANVLFAWRRLQRRGLLERQRHAAPALLPVKITEPTITPTKRASPTAAATTMSAVRRTSAARGGAVEIVLPDQTRIRLSGGAQRAVMRRLLEWLPPRPAPR